MAEIKPIAGMERKRLRDVIPLKTPYSVYIFPTNLCNFRCNYCAHYGGAKKFEAEYGLKPESMTLETFARIVSQLKDFPDKLRVLNLSGQGEPLLNRELSEMIRLAQDAGIAERMEIITNGSLLTHELSEKLVKAGLDCVRISLQGMSDRKYADVCGVALDFQKLVEEISYLYRIRENCQVYVKVMDIALAPGEEAAFYETFGGISDRMYIERCKPVYDSVQMTNGLDVDTDRYGRKHKPRMVCPLPFYMLGILPDGTVSPCETIYIPETLGNVWKETLWDMWQGNKMKAFQDIQMKKLRKTNPQCARCCAPDDVSHPEDDLDG